MKTNNAKYILNVLATPIGNIGEINTRFIETIKKCDILLCEDTRVTQKLINILGIQNNFKYIKFELHNENEKLNYIIDLIKNNHSVALLSDAGYPTISDPGYKLIKRCIDDEIAINIVNGSCSLMHALVASGMSSHEFIYLGFIGSNKNERCKKLQQYKNIENTYIILESVHRLKSCLQDLYEYWGNQKICIAREMTKMHEEFVYTTLNQIENLNIEQKGEFVIIVNNKTTDSYISSETIEQEIKLLLQNEIKVKDISKLISQKYNLNSKEIYTKILNLIKDKNEK